MIQVTLTQALLIYSMVLVFAFIGIYLITEIGVRRYHRVLGKQDLWRCVFCGYSYLDDSGSPITECPRCHSLNSVDDPLARAVSDRGNDIPLESPDRAAARGRRNPSQRKRPHQRRRGPRRR